MRPRMVLIGLALAFLLTDPATAQEPAVVSGLVTTSADGLSLPGATVSIPALKLSAVTDEPFRGQPSPTAPTRCGRRHCAASAPTRSWC
jgi:hypothetical protein